VKIGKLTRDPALVPALPKKPTNTQQAENKGRMEFVLARARAALVANPTWQGSDPDDVNTANQAALKALVKTEVTAAAAKLATLKTTMADTTKTELVDVDVASIDPPQAAAGKKARLVLRYASLFGLGPPQLRAAGIASAGWMHLAEDPSISDDDLHSLVSRRLMMAERMLWYVSTVGNLNRSWGKTGNKWDGTDGWERMFEYPRLPVTKPLIATCNLTGAGTTCDPAGALDGWTKVTRYVHDKKVADNVSSKWKRDPADAYGFFFKNVAGNDPADAVTELFTAHDDFRERNLLMCDQTIHCLHLEALVRVKSKREGNRTWLATLVNAEPDGWLRIFAPMAYDDFKVATPHRTYLASKFESRFFETKQVTISELAIGDHVIVNNHPAYDKCMDPDDVWRLENALVVATTPRLLLQGHGTNPLPFTSTIKVPVEGDKPKLEPSMRRDMLGLFNAKLAELRQLALTENNKPAPLLVLHLPGGDADLVQRTTVAPYSGYDTSDYTANADALARWWIRWDRDTDADSTEAKIEADSAWARWVWEKQLVEITGPRAYFPLWRPKLTKAGQPVRAGGKISAVVPTWVSQEMAPGWDWYYQKGESPDESAVHRATIRRPKVT
jgi:hypothetical protein